MIVVAVLVALAAGVVAVHMIRARFLSRPPISSAAFFKPLPPTQSPQFAIGNPLRSLPLYLRLAVVGLLIAATFPITVRELPGVDAPLGIWLVIDTSASMSARAGGVTRHAEAVNLATQVIAAVEDREDLQPCWRALAFDMEVRYGTASPAAEAALQAVQEFAPRPLGTDVDLLRSHLAGQDIPTVSEGCPPAHVVVLSDRPAPDWLTAIETPRFTWLVAGAPTDNVGLIAIVPDRHPLSGRIDSLSVTVAAYGARPDGVSLQVQTEVAEELLPINWDADGIWNVSIPITTSGFYSLTLSAGGNYAYDDVATLDLDEAGPIRVDWQLADRSVLNALVGTGAWVEDSLAPQLRVAGRLEDADEVPALVVSGGYAAEPFTIADFYEASPLIAGLNFDVIERIGMTAAPLPEDFIPVLRSQQAPSGDMAWIAQRDDPPAAIVPGLPTQLGDEKGAVSNVIFFNAVRWLLDTRDLRPIYVLTDPTHPQIEGARLALHQGEGDTAQRARGQGTVQDIYAGASQPVQNMRPWWPMLLTAAAVLFALDQLLAVWKVQQWI